MDLVRQFVFRLQQGVSRPSTYYILSGTRKTEVLTFSVPPEMRKMIDDLAKQESRTRSELIREAIRRYIAEEKWAQIYRYAEQKALEKGITEDQIEEIIAAERE